MLRFIHLICIIENLFSLDREAFTGRVTHYLSWFSALLGAGILLTQSAVPVRGQEIPAPPAASVPAPEPRPADEIETIEATTQDQEGKIYKLRGSVKIETQTTRIRADEVDYNSETGDISARGHVQYNNLQTKEEIFAERAEYNVNSLEGRFYEVRGTSPARVQTTAGLLTSANPLYFEGARCDKRGEKYYLYSGTATNCKVPNPWWTLKGQRFDITPGEGALAHNAIFKLRGIPLLYTPVFYKALGREERRSGFLSPVIGNTNRRGQVLGLTYYFAPSRSYDATYRATYFTLRGLAHNLDFRGKPNSRTTFGGVLYAVQDRGLDLGGGRVIKRPGFSINVQGRSLLGKGFEARGVLNYVSDFRFRQEFSESVLEAINSEVTSIGFVTKQWKNYSFNLVTTRFENYTEPRTNVFNEQGQLIRPAFQLERTAIRKLPQVELRAREKKVWKRGLPIWLAWNVNAGLLSREQREFTTGSFTERIDLNPRLTTAFRWKHLHIVPSFGIRATHYGEQINTGRGAGRIDPSSLFRRAGDVNVDILLPSLARIYNRRGFWGEKLKHVIEPRVQYRYVNGITDFARTIRFDDADILANTNQVEILVANRLLGKRKNGSTREVVSWEVSQRRFFDPTFGGVVQPNARNVVLESAAFSSFAFIDGRRTYSPVHSNLRVSPDGRFGLEWRADYDPARGGIVNSGAGGDYRQGLLWVNIQHQQIRSNPLLSPTTNQFSGIVAWGRDTRKGINLGSRFNYDYRTGTLIETVGQATYNTDCCGFSVQYRRFGLGFRNENQFRLAFVVANIGSFGTLRRQDRLY
jgi:LPS-assembly protein